MTPEASLLVRTSWESIAASTDELSGHFYSRLFEMDTSAARLFGGVDMPAQRAKLTQSLAFIVAAIDDVDRLVPVVSALGKRHAGYGIEQRHFESVRDALLHALAETSGSALVRSAQEGTTATDTPATTSA